MKSKMKVFVVSLIFSFFAGTLPLFCNTPVKVLKSPHPFYDAKMLSEAVENGKIGKKKIDLVLNILAKYIDNDDLKTRMKSTDNWKGSLGNEIKDAFKDKETEVINPFLQEYLDILGNALNNYSANSRTEADAYIQDVVTKEKTLPSALTPAAKGFLSPVMVVDVLGSFIAKRFKEELTIAYLDKFKKILNNSKDKGWVLLVPTTFTFLENSDPFNFKVFIATLKESIQNDLNNLDSNLKNFLINHKEKLEEDFAEELLKRDLKNITDADFKSKLTDIEKEIVNLKQKKNLTEAKKTTLVKLEKEVLLMKWEKKEDLVDLAILILDLIQDVKSGKHPIDIIDTVSESDYLDGIDENISNPIRLLAILSRNLNNREGNGWIQPEEFKVFAKGINKDFPKLFFGLIFQKELKQLEKIKFNNKALDKIISENEKNIDEIIGKTTKYLNKALIITKNIQNRIEELGKIKEEKEGFGKYYSYLTTVFELVEHGFEIKGFTDNTAVKTDIKKAQKYLDDAKKLLEISKNIHDKAYGAALVSAVEILKKLLPESTIKDEIIKYGTFMVSMANAENAKEMEKVLEAAALPVGSYRIKRASRFNISLNAYPGGFIGAEKLTPGEEEIKGKKWGMNLAFTAPVGIAFSWGKDKKEDDKRIVGPSKTLFLSAIDIGAVVSFRLSGADSGLPEFKWQNIFAPGLYFMCGLKNSPISIGLGIQYGPQLREIRAAEPAGNGSNGTTNISNGTNGENGSQQVAEGIIKSSAFRVGLIIAVDIPIFNIHSKK